MTDLSPLFTPAAIGDLVLPNRIVMAPMTRRKSPSSTPGPDVAAYYARRAAGGVGLIMSEGTTIDHPAASPDGAIPAFHGTALEGWKGVLDAVHAAGGAMMPQLWHLGAVRDAETSPYPDVPSAGPSGLAAPGKKVAEPMTERDIADVIAAFASAAFDAKRLGFEGVELHGAHGYLIDQFFWSGTNERADSWGGDQMRRNRFAVEILRAVRAAVGPTYPIVLRWSQWKMGEYTAKLVDTPHELERFLAPLADAGASAFHCSTRRFWEPEFPDSGSGLNLAGWTKKLTGLPTITVGSVGLSREDSREDRGATIEANHARLSTLAEMLERGEFDFVAIGRALLSNPDWPALVRAGRFDAIKPYSGEALATLT
jgi:2,4-dienoyl-CoA reductase-like NADH-dependent reductase (Old Yellow Enzyme family)